MRVSIICIYTDTLYELNLDSTTRNILLLSIPESNIFVFAHVRLTADMVRCFLLLFYITIFGLVSQRGIL